MKPAFTMKVISFAIAAAVVAAPMPAWTQPVGAAQVTPVAAGAPESQQELDRLLAPIALYPDALLAHVLMASTYPQEVAMAARWSKANPGVTGKALEEAMQEESWAPSVKSLAAVPTVLERMSENPEWMKRLGEAFQGDRKAVVATTQALRGKAQDAGHLKTTSEQVVRTETQDRTTVIYIESSQPETIYVPTYDPAYVYGPWWHGYPPYSMYPPGYYYGSGIAFAAGIFVGAAIRNDVHVEHHKHTSVNRSRDFSRGSGVSTSRAAMTRGSFGGGGGGRGGRR